MNIWVGIILALIGRLIWHLISQRSIRRHAPKTILRKPLKSVDYWSEKVAYFFAGAVILVGLAIVFKVSWPVLPALLVCAAMAEKVGYGITTIFACIVWAVIIAANAGTLSGSLKPIAVVLVLGTVWWLAVDTRKARSR